MKTLNIFIVASLLVIGSASSASVHEGTEDKNLNVPLAPSVWEEAAIEAPESLRFIKAKLALVPTAGFIWGRSFRDSG
jgi:putative NADH-flavin reductase